MIDMFSRYVVATIIPNKKPESVIDSFLDNWVLKMFGAPESILVDNGGEFYNNKMRDLCENFNIKILSTGAESPWQNRLCESNHRHVDLMVEKIMEDDSKIPVERALSQAVYAKNTLTNHLGFSPTQLVTGQQPRLPSAMANKPPAQEGVSITDNVSDRINAIYSARRAFTKVETL